MPLPVQAIRSTTLLVNKRMSGHVGGEVTHPPQGKSLEAVILGLGRLRPEVSRELVRLPIVEHVAPEKSLLVVSGDHATAQQAKDVVLAEHQGKCTVEYQVEGFGEDVRNLIR